MNKKTNKRAAVRVRKMELRWNGWDLTALGTISQLNQHGLFIENPPASLTPSRLKRLVEIAAMDNSKLAEELPAGIGNLTYFQLVGVIEHVCKALGLSPATRRGKKETP